MKLPSLNLRGDDPSKQLASLLAKGRKVLAGGRGRMPVDLHRWLKGSYVIPGANAEPGDEEE